MKRDWHDYKVIEADQRRTGIVMQQFEFLVIYIQFLTQELFIKIRQAILSIFAMDLFFILIDNIFVLCAILKVTLTCK